MSKRKNYDEGTHGNQLRGVLCVLVGAISWGFSGACGQFLFSHYNINTAWLSCMRMLVTGVILTIAYIIRERKAAFDIFKSTRDFFGIILFAIFGVGLCQYAYLEAIHYTNAGIATALQYLAPVMVLIISCVRRLRPPKFREIVAVLLAVGGTFLIATHGNIHQMSISKAGLKWGLLAAFGFCMYTLLPERMLKKWGSQPVVGYGMLICGVVYSCIVKVWTIPVHLDFHGVLAVAAMVFIGTMMAFLLFLQGVHDIGPVRASMISSVEPVSATLFSVLWLGTVMTTMDLVGMACILVMVIILSVKE